MSKNKKPRLNKHKASQYMSKALEWGLDSNLVDQPLMEDCLYHYMSEFVKLKTIKDSKVLS